MHRINFSLASVLSVFVSLPPCSVSWPSASQQVCLCGCCGSGSGCGGSLGTVHCTASGKVLASQIEGQSGPISEMTVFFPTPL